MSRLFRFVAVWGLVVLSGDLATAQQPTAEPTPPDILLIRGLRNQGTPDLALEYIQKLLAKPDLPPDLAAAVALELARTKLVLAEAEGSDLKRRNALVVQARSGFESFLKQYPTHPEYLTATLDLSRLLVQEGKAHIHQANHYKDENATEAEAKAKELIAGRHDLFRAAKLYENASAILEERRKTATEPLKEQLSLQIRHGDIEWGIIYFDIANTIPFGGGADSSAATRQLHARVLDQARKIFQGVMDDKKKDAVYWVGMVWSAQCAYRSSSETKGFEDFVKLSGGANAITKDGYRLYRYFQIEQGFENRGAPGSNTDPLASLAKLESDTVAWLRDYPAYHHSREGLKCTYFAAIAKYEIGMAQFSNAKKGPVSDAIKQRLNDAAGMFEELTETLNEYTQGAQTRHDKILATLTENAGVGQDVTPESLGDLERNVMAAKMQVIKLNKFIESKKPKPDEKEKTPQEKEKAALALAQALKQEHSLRFTNAIRYLDYGLSHAAPSDSLRRIQCPRFARVLLLSDGYAAAGSGTLGVAGPEFSQNAQGQLPRSMPSTCIGTCLLVTGKRTRTRIHPWSCRTLPAFAACRNICCRPFPMIRMPMRPDILSQAISAGTKSYSRLAITMFPFSRPSRESPRPVSN